MAFNELAKEAPDGKVSDEEIVRFLWGKTYKCTHSEKVKRVAQNGKLTLELAKFIVERLGELIDKWLNEPCSSTITIGNGDLHRDADYLWKWYIQSMNFYTIEEAREIAKVILEIDRNEFWYA
jgi:hypothetical protein